MKITKSNLDKFIRESVKMVGGDARTQKVIAESVKKRMNEYYLSDKINNDAYGMQSKVRDEARAAFKQFVQLQMQHYRKKYPQADDAEISELVKSAVAEAVQEEEKDYYGDDPNNPN